MLGTALVGLVLEKPEEIDQIIERLDNSKFEYEYLKPGTPEYKVVG